MGVHSSARSVLALALIACLSLLSLAACTPPGAFQAVATQNDANTEAQAANTALLAAAAHDLARLHTTAILQQARERVAADLTRLRLTITPDNPSDAELADTTTPWSRSLAAEVAALASRLNISPPDQRPQVAESLADDHPATIDLALAAPSFSAQRILHDAIALDHLNIAIESESNPQLRTALHAQRNTLLDTYLPARLAQHIATLYLAALDQLITTTNTQSTIARTHATAFSRAAAPSTINGAPLATFQNPDLRTAILDLVAHEWGQQSADQLRTRLKAIDSALAAVAPPPTR